MLKKLLLSMIAAAAGVPTPIRAFTRDAAFPFRMDGGIPGDVDRTHPFDVEANVQSAVPATAYGQATIPSANGMRPYTAGDEAVDTPYGVTVRPFPTQQTTGGMSSAFGAGTPPGAKNVIDVLRRGYIVVKIPAAEAAVAAKGGAVFVRTQNSPGADDPVGGFKAQADGGNTAALDAKRFQWHGPADAKGNVLLMFKV